MDQFYNYKNEITFTPTAWFKSSHLINHSEAVGPIPGIEDKVEDTLIFQVNDFQPYFPLKHSFFPSFIKTELTLLKESSSLFFFSA